MGYNLELKNRAWSLVEVFSAEAIELNDYMADNPEISLEEYNSSKAIVSILRKHNIKVEYPFAGFDTAFKGCINPDKKRRVALLAEYDALRGLGHACGHCASGSITVLTILAFQEMHNQIDFGIDIIGTPDEEITGVKARFADMGIFSGYDFVAMMHMGPCSSTAVDFIALDGTSIYFHGRAAHASSEPEKGLNAFNAARLFFDAVDMMRQHVTKDVQLHGIIKHAGDASNIVPDFAEIEFVSRAAKRANLETVTEWCRDCARAAALATHTEVDIVRLGEKFNELHVSELEKKIMADCFKEIGVEFSNEILMTGSSDIGNADYYCPTFHPIMGIGIDKGCHTVEFADAMKTDKTHESIVLGAKYLVALVFNLYMNETLLNELKTEHKEYRGY